MSALLLARLRRAVAGPRTIRARLTLWYVALLAVILGGFSALLYLSLAQSLRGDLDRQLVDEARQITATLGAPVRGKPQRTSTMALSSKVKA